MSEPVVVQFNLSPVLMLFLFYGSSEGIAGFLISFPLLESGSSSLYLSAAAACNPWFLVGISTYGHCWKDVIDALTDEADVVYSSMPLEESRNIFQSVLANSPVA